MAMADIADQAAQHGRDRAVPLSEIAARQHLPIAYLEQLFGKLRDANLVASVRGRSGGYRLARPASEIVVVDVLTAVEEPTRMTRCSGADGPGCVGEARCLTHGLWSSLGQHIHGFLAGISLADIVGDRIPMVPSMQSERAAVTAHD